MILPKLSAAILSMSLLGSAYAASRLERDISLDQWVLMCGAANGAADAAGATEEDRHKHRKTARSHLMRYAAEHGYALSEFDALFELGMLEGRKLVAARSARGGAKFQALMHGFHSDKSIQYGDVEKALDTT
ncbi:hypothetical protein [Pollutimonas bauzanensis]|uniref:Lipoprotein n=1 Tax=Pollutimonas bauzanensis TaxID=658167 RepID=A0A1M6AWF2_9BURK|nr:hypothetical protein [Pollutimonas bauzanensis]SHI40824.1 hypothetical protein SAMN04488135_12342 [Pollutimonas bauzanensis]